MNEKPIIFVWSGEAMIPRDRRFAYQCDRQFVVGEHYTLVQHEDRSSLSHRHYFFAISEAWKNLPEQIADRFSSPEHLRKWALIKAGYRDERTHVAATKAEARRLAAFMAPIDDFAIVTATGLTVTVWTAKSQSTRAMNKQEFSRSKEAVLGVLADLIGTSKEALTERAKEVA
jgi:hypothetical protein